MKPTGVTHSNRFLRKQGFILVLKRSAAYLFDIVVLFIVLAPLGFLIQWALGLELAQTGPEVARTVLWNFSLPAWLYFTVSDRSAQGATFGKRLLKLQVIRMDNKPISTWNALLRTAVKLLPWELVHIFAFALSVDLAQLASLQTIGLILANALMFLYTILFIVTGGRRSVHDFAAQTEVMMG